MKSQLAVAQRHIGGGDAVKAAQVFGPRFVDDLFKVAPRLSHVVQQLPAQRTLTQPAAAAVLHQLHKGGSARRVDQVLNGGHHLSGARRGLCHGHFELA